MLISPLLRTIFMMPATIGMNCAWSLKVTMAPSRPSGSRPIWLAFMALLNRVRRSALSRAGVICTAVIMTRTKRSGLTCLGRAAANCGVMAVSWVRTWSTVVRAVDMGFLGGGGGGSDQAVAGS